MGMENRVQGQMTYEEAISFIHDTYKFGSKLGLENIRALLQKMGNPQDQLKFVHIAGTNGKGSTAAFISRSLMAQGYRVGFYISPYLQRFNERIQINGGPIEDAALARHASRAKVAVAQMVSEGMDHPTEFEIVTAIGFDYFANQGVDVVVLEVGLGGRLDSTNVIGPPLVSVITPIGLDHVQYLGDTVEKIAYEKAGIIKSGSSVVSAKQVPGVMAVIDGVALEKGLSVVYSNHEGARIVKSDFKGTDFDYKGVLYHIDLLGEHQVQNACTAIEALRVLSHAGVLKVDEQAIVKGLSETRWPGRFEVINKDPLLIIDGAHNLHGVLAFKAAVQRYQPSGRRIAIFGMMSDKDVEEVLTSVSGLFEAYYTVVPDNPRAMSHEEIARVLVKIGFAGPIIALDHLNDLLGVIGQASHENVAFYSFGSLYYIGEVRTLLAENKKI